MYVTNHNSVSQKYECNKPIYNYLISSGFHLLSRDGKKYYFSLTEKLSKALENLPWRLRFFKGVQLGE